MNTYFLVLFSLLFMLLVAFLTLRHVNVDKDWIYPWRDFSRHFGLVYEPGTALKPALLMGTYRSYFVKVELGQFALFESGATLKYIRITLDLGRQSNGRLFLREKPSHIKLPIDRGNKEAFENFFAVEGEPMGLVNQVLDTDDIRRRLFQFHPSRLLVKEDKLLFFSDYCGKDIEKVQFLMDLLCDIAKIVTDRKRYFDIDR
jgi:hypothetical protein